MSKVNSDQPSTSKVCDPLDHVVAEDYVSDEDDISNEKPITSVVVEQVFEESKEYKKVLKDKGKHYLESHSVVYPRFKDTYEVLFSNQVFVTTGNGDKVDPELNKLIKEDNKGVKKESFYSNQNTIENGLNKNLTTCQQKN